jgi:hypothetical protein
VGGRSPVAEFQRIANEEFAGLEAGIEARVLAAFRALPDDPARIDAGRMGLRGPASTWTYLVTDQQFGLWVSLLHGSNIGATAVAAGAFGPLYLLMGIVSRLAAVRRSRRRSGTSDRPA